MRRCTARQVMARFCLFHRDVIPCTWPLGTLDARVDASLHLKLDGQIGRWAEAWNRLLQGLGSTALQRVSSRLLQRIFDGTRMERRKKKHFLFCS
jgi:hypothetical protein